MKRRILAGLLAVAMMVGMAIGVSAQDSFMYFNESNAGGAFNPLYHIANEDNTLDMYFHVQAFVPDTNKISGVKLLQIFLGSTVTLHVEIRTTVAPDADSVVQADNIQITGVGNKTNWYLFNFSKIVTVTPGQTYYLAIYSIGRDTSVPYISYQAAASGKPHFYSSKDNKTFAERTDLCMAFEMLAADPQASAVYDLIDALPNPVTLDDEAAVVSARAAYDALPSEKKELVANFSVLTAAEEKIEALKKDLVTQGVIAKINALPEAASVALSDEDMIVQARAAYLELDTSQRANVTNYSKLTAAESALASLKLIAGKPQAIQNVVAAIDAIGTVTQSSGDAIKAAEDLSAQLVKDYGTDVLAEVTNYSVLTEARKSYNALFGIYDVTYGDVNNDGKINTTDALLTLRCAVKKITLTGSAAKAADVSYAEDGINTTDALLILRYAVKKIDRFPVQDRGLNDSGITPDSGVSDWYTSDYERETPQAVAEKLEKYTGEMYYTHGKITTASKLYYVDKSALSAPEATLVQSLMGITAQNGTAQIYMRDGASSDVWMQALQDNYGITFEKVNNIWELVDRFKDQLTDNGYVTYTLYDTSAVQSDNEKCSINVASTIAGQEKYLIVEKSLEAKAQAAGLVKKMQATDWDQYEIYQKYQSTFNKDVIFSIPYTIEVGRDLGIALGGLFFRESMDDFDTILSKMNTNGLIMGWHDQEDVGVMTGTLHGIATLASDYAVNNSVYAGLQKNIFVQTTPAKYEVKNSSDVHYVTMVMTDGDNINYLENGFVTNKKYWGADNRGSIPIGWTIQPLMVEIQPALMDHLYKTATVNDNFVAAVSGLGYMYALHYGQDTSDQMGAVKEYYRRMAEYITAADLNYISVWEWHPDTVSAAKRLEYLNIYTASPQVKGGFYSYSEDLKNGDKGAIYWSSNGTPFVNYRETLIYASGHGCTEAAFVRDKYELMEHSAYRINHSVCDPSSINGYTAVTVHCWDYGVTDLINFTHLLDDHVVVVTPAEFFELITKNVSKVTTQTDCKNYDQYDYSSLKTYVDTRAYDTANAELMIATDKTNWNFDNYEDGTEGWQPVVSGGSLDYAQFTEVQDYGYGIILIGTHGGTQIQSMTAGIYNKIALSKTVGWLSVSGVGGMNTADIRIQAMSADGTVKTILDWTRATAKTSTFKADIAEYAGQDVTFYIQFSDGSSNGSNYTVTSISVY